MRRVLLGWLALLLAVQTGCRLTRAGLDASRGSPGDAPTDRLDPTDLPADRAPRPDRGAAPLDAVVPSLPGLPEAIGCADGSRESFLDYEAWPDIAGCAGGWRVPGLRGFEARTPQCGRGGGDGGDNPWGVGCSVADLCAEGWHVCRDAEDVDRRSRSGCENSDGVSAPRFFLVLAGASPQGACHADPLAANDLHGCGTLGQPESSGCQPLDRRMGFTDCTETGVWWCGAAPDHLNEANLVLKRDATLGGVLCCRDP